MSINSRRSTKSMALHLIRSVPLNKTGRLPEGREESTVTAIVSDQRDIRRFDPLQNRTEWNSMVCGCQNLEP
jgi:hypothetical protein